MMDQYYFLFYEFLINLILQSCFQTKITGEEDGLTIGHKGVFNEYAVAMVTTMCS